MALTGDLKDIPLTNLVQMNAQSNLTGRLLVSQGTEQARVFFEQGEIVHAELGDESGKDAFYQLLTWESGTFAFDADIAPAIQTITMHWSDLLLSGLQQLDEGSNHREAAPLQESHIPEDLGELFGLEKQDNSPSQGEKSISEDEIMAQTMQEILAELGSEAPGLFAAIVAGMDGLAVADYSKRSVDVDMVSAQMTLLIKLVETTAEKSDAGKVEDYLLTTDKAYLLIRFLGDSDYYLGIGAARNASSLGKLRLYSRVYSERLNTVLPR